MTVLKLLTVFGTRPEIIKLAPFIQAVSEDHECLNIICATGQHREMQNETLSLFHIKPDYDLDIMVNGQDLFHITRSVLEKINPVLEKESPHYVVVQGDTTTAFAAALAAFYKKIPVVHIEAGLRTNNIYSPFPEEANRSMISKITTLHMAPTQRAVEALSQEGITQGVFKTGNTIVDSIQLILNKHQLSHEILSNEKPIVLITVHRRENFGQPLVGICSVIKELSTLYPEYQFIWPLHPNPNVRDIVKKTLSNIKNIYLLNPLPYPDLLHLIQNSSLLISDSGGIQEEACILGKRILILREETEREEVIHEGFGVLVGSNREKIIATFKEFTCSSPMTEKPSQIYGIPGVSKAILTIIKRHSLT